MYGCVTYCMYHDVHEACHLMDIFVNTENVMLLFVFVSFLLPLSFHPFKFGCSLLCLFYTLSCSLCLFLSLLLRLSVCLCLLFLFPLPDGRGHRKLVDCPQLLDVDDMVKMREPDWKCVYTYLQEFYRGLVTKGLVKTKNSP